jgi:hypothetical protein
VGRWKGRDKKKEEEGNKIKENQKEKKSEEMVEDRKNNKIIQIQLLLSLYIHTFKKKITSS